MKCARCLAARATSDAATLHSPSGSLPLPICANCFEVIANRARSKVADGDAEVCLKCGEPRIYRGYALSVAADGRALRATICRNCYDQYMIGVAEAEDDAVTEDREVGR